MKAGKPDQKLGGVIGDHDDPGNSDPRGVEGTVQENINKLRFRQTVFATVSFIAFHAFSIVAVPNCGDCSF